MNKAWQDEIYKIGSIMATSPDKAEFATIVDEMKNRTRELNTIRQIEAGELAVSVMQDLCNQCQQRHAAMIGNQQSSYQSPGKLTNQEVIQNNQQWENLLNLTKNYMTENSAKLAVRNELYLNELKGRIDDLSQFKFIINAPVPGGQGGKKMKKSELQQLRLAQMKQKTKNLNLKVGQRHKENENAIRNTMNLAQNQKDQKEFQNVQNNDGSWRVEFEKDTNALCEFFVN